MIVWRCSITCWIGPWGFCKDVEHDNSKVIYIFGAQTLGNAQRLYQLTSQEKKKKN